MLELLKEQPADNILSLMGMYSNDKRPNKLDLGVGVYKNQDGITRIMRAVKTADTILLNNQNSKSYVFASYYTISLLTLTFFIYKQIKQ